MRIFSLKIKDILGELSIYDFQDDWCTSVYNTKAINLSTEHQSVHRYRRLLLFQLSCFLLPFKCTVKNIEQVKIGWHNGKQCL